MDVKYMAKSNYKRKSSRRRRTKKHQILSVILFLVIAFMIYYVSQSEETLPTPIYSIQQNEEGFYYYQENVEQDYYVDTNHLIGKTLKDELHVIVNQDKHLLNYLEVRQALEIVDRDTQDPTKLWGIYDSVLHHALWDGGVTWNREHVWPNSRLGMESVEDYNRNQATDLHNLRAASRSINSSKSDRFFSEGHGIAKTTDDGGYYPGDEHRGDVARILFYMAITYDFLFLTDDDLLDETNHYTMDGTKMGKLTVLLEWHKLDPVSDFEIERNEQIFKQQGNRNPLIDRPEFVHLIWEDKTISDLLKPEIETSFSNHILYYSDRKERYDNI